MSNGSHTDPFDEFEFKPLTDGLGFHKKGLSLKDGLQKSGVLDEQLQTIPSTIPNSLLDDTKKESIEKATRKTTFEDVLSALEKSPLKRTATAELEFTEPLPREPKRQAMEIETPRPIQSPFPGSDAYRAPTPKPIVPDESSRTKSKSVNKKNISEGMRRGAADSPKTLLDPATLSIPSAILDFIMVSALAVLFLIALLTITKVDAKIVMRNLQDDLMTQAALAVLYLSVMQMYVVISRAFFGQTLGEWTFDLQVGTEAEQKYESYPLRIAFRSLLVTLTGLFLLPLISALIGRDIAGQVSGARLYRQRL